MKKTLSLIIFILITTVCATSGFCQRTFKSSTLINGFWGNWQDNPYYRLKGDFNDFIIYSSFAHPSAYILRVKIDNFSIETDKKAIKRMLNSQEYYGYTGTVEFYATSIYPDFKTQITIWPYSSLPNAIEAGVIQRVRNAKIQIQPYKKDPEVFNIFFDNVGIAIQIQ